MGIMGKGKNTPRENQTENKKTSVDVVTDNQLAKKKPVDAVNDNQLSKKKDKKEKNDVNIKVSEVKNSSRKRKKKTKAYRAPTAYNCFMRAKMSTITEGNQTEKLKKVAAQWKEISPEEHKKYIEIAQKEKEDYLENNKDKIINETVSKPSKRVPNAYNLFLKDRMTVVSGDNQKDKLIKIASEWKTLEEKIKIE